MKQVENYSHKPGPLYLGMLFLYFSAIFLIYFNNHALFDLINGLGRDFFRYPMLAMTVFGDGVTVLVVGSLLYKYKRGRFLPFLAAFVVTAILIQAMKLWFNAPRPLLVFESEQVFFMGEQLFQKSFPSGHSASAMVLACFLQQGVSRPWSIFFFGAGALSAISRIYIGAHFPFDVIIGGGIGYLTAHHFHIFAAKRALHKDRPEYKRALPASALLGLIAALAGIFTIAYRYFPLTPGLQLIFALASLYFIYVIYTQGIKTAKAEF